MHVHSLCVECVYRASPGPGAVLPANVTSSVGSHAECRAREDCGIFHFALVLVLDCTYSSTNYVSFLEKRIPNSAELPTEHYKTVSVWEALENTPSPLDQRRHLPFHSFAIKASMSVCGINWGPCSPVFENWLLSILKV